MRACSACGIGGAGVANRDLHRPVRGRADLDRRGRRRVLQRVVDAVAAAPDAAARDRRRRRRRRDTLLDRRGRRVAASSRCNVEATTSASAVSFQMDDKIPGIDPQHLNGVGHEGLEPVQLLVEDGRELPVLRARGRGSRAGRSTPPSSTVSGVLNSCASASSTVARSSLLSRAASARAVASSARARSSPIAVRLAIDCSTVSLSARQPRRTLPIGAPPSWIAVITVTRRVVQGNPVPGDFAEPVVQRRQFLRARPRDGVGPLVVEASDSAIGMPAGDVSGDVRRPARCRPRKGGALGSSAYSRSRSRCRVTASLVRCRARDRQLARDDGGQQERGQRDPVLRISDCERADGRKEEEVEAQHRGDRRCGRLGDAPPRRDQQDHDEVAQGGGQRVDVQPLRLTRA